MNTPATHRPADDDLLASLSTFKSTRAKNQFRELIDTVNRNADPVVITRNNRPTAVMLSVQAYEELVRAIPDPLATLEVGFDAMLEKMQTPEAKAGVDHLFDAAPEALGSAAVEGARDKR
jgi:prevent-host-death family protein